MSSPATRAPLIFQVTVAAPPEQVFEVFFQQPTRWLCRGGGFGSAVDSGVRLTWSDGTVQGRLLQYDPPRGGRFAWGYEGDPLPETMVVVSLEAVARDGQPATRLELEHYGFGGGLEWEPGYLGAVRAWAGYLKNLRAVIETGRDLREPEE